MMIYSLSRPEMAINDMALDPDLLLYFPFEINALMENPQLK